MSDEEITTAIEDLRSRIDLLASIDTDTMLIPGETQERYHQLVGEACARLSLIETHLDKLRDAKLAKQEIWEDSLFRTAYHEAGHAVAAIVEKRYLRLVTIVPTKDSVGLCSTSGLQSQRRFESEIIVSLAGPIAEKHFCGNNLANSEHDHKMTLELASHLVDSEEELNAYLNLLKIRIEGLVHRHYRQIAALASALITERTIQGKRAREIFTYYTLH